MSGHVQVVAAALVDGGTEPVRLLAGCRSAPASLAGLWEFPGGKVEAGEELTDALRRELREELGIGVRLGEEVPGPDPDGWPLREGVGMRLFLAEITEGEPAPLQDHDCLRWLPVTPGLEDLVPWIPADREIVRAVVAALTAG